MRSFPVRTEHWRLKSCLLYGFLLWLCRLIIGPWALRENKALELGNQSACYMNYEHKPTGYWVNVVSPRSSFAISTSIRSSVLSVCQVSSSTRSTPSLMLHSKHRGSQHQRDEGTFPNGILSSSVISSNYWVATINSWDSSSSSVFEATKWFDWGRQRKAHVEFFIN